MKILLAYDGSGESNRSIECLNRLPIPSQSKVFMLHAVQPVLSETSVMPGHDYSELMRGNDAIHQKAKGVLEKAKQKYCKKDLDIEFLVQDGPAAEVILEVAEKKNPQLVIVGSRGLNPVKSYFLGSVSHKVLQYAMNPVLVNRGFHPARPDAQKLNILVGFDDSPVSNKLCQYLLDLPLENVERLSFVSVLEPPPELRLLDDVGFYFNEMKDSEKEIEKKLAEITGNFAKRYPHLELKSEIMPINKNIANTLSEYANDGSYDLIALGNKGKNSFEKFLLGNVSQKIAEYSPLSVLVFKDH